MIRFPSFVLLILICALGWTAQTGAATLEDYARKFDVPIYELEILAEIPHDTSSWTQGFLYDDGILYESTGQYGSSSVQKLDAKTGQLLQEIKTDSRYFGEGLALLGNELYQLTWLENTVIVYNRKDLSLLRKLSYDTEGWGLTTVGQTLVMSDGSNKLYFREPDKFALENSVEVRLGDSNLRFLNELEYAHHDIYANLLNADFIVEIDPSSGMVTGMINASVLRQYAGAGEAERPLNGIAYDSANDTFYLTGKLWPKIFCVKFVRKF